MTITRSTTLRQLIDAGAGKLRTSDAKTAGNPRREATLLLQAAVGLDRAQLFSRFHEVVMPPQADRYWNMIQERARGMPLQLILGEAAFHEVSLKVEPGVFIPRPETERLVEGARAEIGTILKSKPGPGRVRVLDLCTGSGAVAVAIASCFAGTSSVSVYAGDWNPQAVRLARRNCEKNGVRGHVEVRRSNLFSAFADLEGKIDVLVSNPPYIAPEESESLPIEVRLGDPREALIDAQGGTGFHRRISSRGTDFLVPSGLLIMEIGETQGTQVTAMLEESGYTSVQIVQDLAGRDRFARGRWPGRGFAGRGDPSTRSS